VLSRREGRLLDEQFGIWKKECLEGTGERDQGGKMEITPVTARLSALGADFFPFGFK
jgi:hypothetical protein